MLGCSRQTTRILRLLPAVAIVAVALLLAACGGTTAVTPQCLKINSGCYAVARYFKQGSGYVGSIQGVYTQSLVVPLTCLAACVQEHGFVANYLLIGNSAYKVWTEVGYRTEGALGGENFYYLGESTGTSLYFFNYYQVQPQDIGHQLILTLFHRLNTNITYAALAAAEFGGFSDIMLPSLTGAVEYGQMLHGLNGEAAKSDYFANTRYTNVALNMQPDPITFSPQPYPALFQGAGSLLLDQPPYAKWIGPTLYVECCTAFP